MNSRLTIKLLSDMCCGTGEGNGSTIDVRTTFDEAGLPIIPGKRIKGLLREQADFMAEYGQCEQSDVDRLFGNGDAKGKIIVHNGIIKSGDVKRTELIACSGKYPFITREKVVECFTTVRTQTAIDENGIAMDASLRNIELIKRGLEFYADIEIVDATQKDMDLLKKCTKLLRSIGMNKTRGFGEVNCSLEFLDSGAEREIAYSFKGVTQTVKYTVALKEDVAFSGDYISGSMIQGAFAAMCCSRPWFNDVILNGTGFGNAYISNTIPVPLSFVAEKNKTDRIFDLASGFEKASDKQYVSVKGYVSTTDNKFAKKSVDTERDFHCVVERSDIFGLKKITSGQEFTGLITGDAGAIEVLRALIKQNHEKISLGASSTAQYAGCKIWFSEPIEDEKIKIEDEMIIRFLSDVIMIDAFGYNTALVAELEKKLHGIIAFDSLEEIFTSTVTVGGYNAKWKLPKRQYTAFAKGTTVVLKGCTGDSVSKTGLLGYLNSEGYGRYEILHKGFDVYDESEQAEKEKSSLPCTHITDIIDKTELLALCDCMKEYGAQIGAQCYKSFHNSLSSSAAMRIITAYYKSGITPDKPYDFGANEDLKKMQDKIIVSFNFEKADTENFRNETFEKNKDYLFDVYLKACIAELKTSYKKGDDAQ